MLIDASNSYYSSDICPGFWEALSQVKSVISIDRVKHEIVKKEEKKDEEVKLAKWAKNVQKSFFVSTDDESVISKQEEIANWIWKLEKPKDFTKKYFLEGADIWLIAYSIVHETVMVTLEIPVNSESKKIKIPNVCKEFNVECVNTFHMLKELGIEFRLSRKDNSLERGGFEEP